MGESHGPTGSAPLARAHEQQRKIRPRVQLHAPRPAAPPALHRQHRLAHANAGSACAFGHVVHGTVPTGAHIEALQNISHHRGSPRAVPAQNPGFLGCEHRAPLGSGCSLGEPGPDQRVDHAFGQIVCPTHPPQRSASHIASPVDLPTPCLWAPRGDLPGKAATSPALQLLLNLGCR